MIVEINAVHTEGEEPLGSWLWYTAVHASGEVHPLPAWYCTNTGEPKVIGEGWFAYPFNGAVVR